MQIISFTTASFFPYPYYGIGLVFFLPFCCQQAINLLCVFLLFPETLAHQFADRLIATLHPLQDVIRMQADMLRTNPRSAEWLAFKKVRASANAALGGVALLGMSEANLSREVAFAKVSGRDLTRILGAMRVVVGRTSGFVSFFNIVESHLHRDESDAKGGAMANDLVIHLDRSGPNSPAPSRPASVMRASSEQDNREEDDEPHLRPTPIREGSAQGASSPLAAGPEGSKSPIRRRRSDDNGFASASRNSSSASLAADQSEDTHHEQDRSVGFHELPSPKREKARSRSRHRHGHHHKSSSHVALGNLLHDVLHPTIDIRRVGVVESGRYADLEDMLHNPRDEAHLEEIVRHLADATTPLIEVLDSAAGQLITSIHRLKRQDTLWYYLFPQKEGVHEENVRATKELRDQLAAALKLYKEDKRLDVVRPYAHLFDSSVGKEYDRMETPSHRGIFWAFSYQFSIMGWADALLDVFDHVAKVEQKRRKPRFWLPAWAKFRFGHNTAEASWEDENPDAPVSGMNQHLFRAPRDPDAAPATTRGQLIGVRISNAMGLVSRKDVLFGVKAGIVIALCAMPTWFKSSCYFFYKQRGLWVTIMAALTLTQYVGDTTFGFVVRVVGTFVGAW